MISKNTNFGIQKINKTSLNVNKNNKENLNFYQNFKKNSLTYKNKIKRRSNSSITINNNLFKKSKTRLSNKINSDKK